MLLINKIVNWGIEFSDKIVNFIIAKLNYICNSNWLIERLLHRIKHLISHEIFSIYDKYTNKWINNNLSNLSSDYLRYFVIPPVIWYFICYKKFGSASISEIYQDDKYGIVILHSVIISLNTFHLIWKEYIQDIGIISGIKEYNEANNILHGIGTLNWRIQKVYVAGIIANEALRIISFNLIFNNHTSDNKLLNGIHIYHVLQYGFFSLMRHMLFVRLIKPGELFLKRRCVWTAFYGSIFLMLEYFIYNKHNWSNSKSFNTIRVVSEVLAIAHSI